MAGFTQTGRSLSLRHMTSIKPDRGVSAGTIAAMVAQSTAPNAIKPALTPSWRDGGRMHVDGIAPGVFTAVVPWIVIDRAAGVTVDPDVLHQTRNLRLWYRLATGPWLLLLNFPRPDGRLIIESFADEAGIPHWDYTATGTKTSELEQGYVDHQYGAYRALIPAGVAGWLVEFEGRITSKTGADLSARESDYLACAGGDYWLDLDNPFTLPRGSSNRDFAIGSFTPLTQDWRKFYLSTDNASALAAQKPPAGLDQLIHADPVALDPDITIGLGSTSGAVVGAPGSLPHGWSIQTGAADVVAIGTDIDQVEGVSISFTGVLVLIAPYDVEATTLAQGDQVRASGYLKRLVGDADFFRFDLLEFDGPALLGTIEGASFGAADLANERRNTLVVASAATDRGGTRLVAVDGGAGTVLRLGALRMRRLPA